MSGEFDYNSQNEVWYQTRNDSLQFFKNGNEDLIKTAGAQIQFSKLSKRIEPFVNIFTGLGYQYTKLDKAVPSRNFLIQSSNEQYHTSIFYRLEHDTRDNIYFPLEGIFISPEVSIHRFGFSEASHNIQFKLKAQRYSQIKPKVYIALSLNTKLNTLSTLGYLNTKQLGYDRIIRGFEHYVVEGLFGTNVTAALKYHLLDKSDLKLNFVPIKNYKILPFNAYLEFYADGGYVDAEIRNNQTTFPEETNSLPNTLLFSGGLGLNLLFYNDRILRLEYSVNSLKDHGIFVHFQKAI